MLSLRVFLLFYQNVSRSVITKHHIIYNDLTRHLEIYNKNKVSPRELQKPSNPYEQQLKFSAIA